MLNRFFGVHFHAYFHLFGTTVVLVGLPTTKILMSIGTMLLLLNALLEGNYQNQWANLKKNTLFWLIGGFWFLHVIGLAWTTEINYAFNDIRIKLPLIVLPLTFATRNSIDLKNYTIPLLLFLAALLFTTVFNVASYNHWIGSRLYDDIRGLSLFGSHIRFGILVSMGVATGIYLFTTMKSSWRWLLIPVILWFVYYTYYAQVISGLIALIAILLTYAIGFSFQWKKWLGFSLITLFVGLTCVLILFIANTEKENHSFQTTNLPTLTAKGNPYTHDFGEGTIIHGKPVFAYVCEKELKEAWEKRSKISIDSLDIKGQPIRFTLMRYLTSKDLFKDASGVNALKDNEIKFIEQGITSVEETKTGLKARFEGIRFQLNHNSDPNGHSLLQRLEYWKTGISIIKQYLWLGVGTGDVQKAFDDEYTKTNSPLTEKNRLRAHNSYLTAWITFGIGGFALFLSMIVLFTRIQCNKKDLFALSFIIVACSTFFIEDTLETQAGVTFFAMFYALFLTLPTRNQIK